VVAETRIPSFASSPWIRTQPHRVFSRASLRINSQAGRIEWRPPDAALPSVGPLPPHQFPVPPQQRRGTHHEGGPSWTGEHPARRGEHHPVEPAEARALLLTPHDLQLVTKDEYLDVLGQILRPGATREAEEPTYNDLEQGEQHGSSPFRSKEG